MGVFPLNIKEVLYRRIYESIERNLFRFNDSKTRALLRSDVEFSLNYFIKNNNYEPCNVCFYDSSNYNDICNNGATYDGLIFNGQIEEEFKGALKIVSVD